MRLKGPFSGIFKTKASLLLILFTLIDLASAFLVIYNKHHTRFLHAAIQRMYQERSQLNTEWSKLLLERSTWLSDLRVETEALHKLKMATPEQVEIIMP